MDPIQESNKREQEARRQDLEQAATCHALDPLDGIDNPGYVIRCLVIDAMKMFFRDNGYEATRVGITPAMEALLSTSDPDIKRMIETKGKLRTWPLVFGMQPTFDSTDFYLD